ncbi:hypothetical protein [Sporolactobacillus putidus]|uniref:Uncharacterized protein n=1 Tax=Sporolactobacillus putidus TaxID=492735 RepID=A0A917W073_9BACL|nr:hypothetical protein [Sporolactobacillus putidus]GGL50814.1 hypothetical protein GCM10007968_13830 [Sporolactobacillus putidus]
MKKENPRIVQVFSGLGCSVGLIIDGIIFLLFHLQDKNWIYQTPADVRWVTVGTVLLLFITAGSGIGWIFMSKRRYKQALMHASQSFGITIGSCIGLFTLNMGYGYIIFIVVLGACSVMGATIGRLLTKTENE